MVLGHPLIDVDRYFRIVASLGAFQLESGCGGSESVSSFLLWNCRSNSVTPTFERLTFYHRHRALHKKRKFPFNAKNKSRFNIESRRILILVKIIQGLFSVFSRPNGYFMPGEIV